MDQGLDVRVVGLRMVGVENGKMKEVHYQVILFTHTMGRQR